MKELKKIAGVLSIIVCVLFLSLNEVHAKSDFDSLLTNGKLVINGVEPKSTIEASDRTTRYLNWDMIYNELNILYPERLN